MKKHFLFFLFFALSATEIHAQNYILGKITNEDEIELRGVLITNIDTKEQTLTDNKGNFMIRGKIGEEIRFTRSQYERTSVKINDKHYNSSLMVTMKVIPVEIEEVEIKYKMTGDLETDAKHFGKSKKITKLEDELRDYIKQKSSSRTMAPKAGEFVQPVNPGIPIGRVQRKWTDVDLMINLEKLIEQEFFVNDLKLTTPEISNFIFYVLRDFERKNILKYGTLSTDDISRFMMKALDKIKDYKRNIPVSKKRKHRLIFKK